MIFGVPANLAERGDRARVGYAVASDRRGQRDRVDGVPPEGRDSEALLDEAEREVFAIRDGRASEDAPRRADDLVVSVRDRLEDLAEHGGQVTGVASGFGHLDGLTVGFQPADLVMIAGRPSMGKTALMVNMAEHAVLAEEGTSGRGAGVLGGTWSRTTGSVSRTRWSGCATARCTSSTPRR